MHREQLGLPVELLSSIASFADQGTRARLAAVSWASHEAALPWLYHSPTWVSIKQLRRFAKHVPSSYCRWIRTIDLSLISRRWTILSEQELANLLLCYTGAMDDHSMDSSNDVSGSSQYLAHLEGASAVMQHHAMSPLWAMGDEEDTTANGGAAQRRNRLTVRQSYRHSVLLPPIPVVNHSRCRLERLNIGWTNIRDRTLTMVLAHCGASLRELSLDNCRLTDITALAVAQWCPNLLRLDMGGTDISDDGVSALAEGCSALRRLSLSDCDLVTDESVEQIAKHCRNLRMLDIEGCYGVLTGLPPQTLPTDHNAPMIGVSAPNDDEWLTDVEEDDDSDDSDDSNNHDVIEAA